MKIKTCLLMFGMTIPALLLAEPVNALYNGDLTYGAAGWAVLGAESEFVTLKADEFEQKPALKIKLSEGGSFRLYSQHPIKIKEGKEYELKARLRGNGETVSLGLITYDKEDNHIGYSFADPVAIPPGETVELQYVFHAGAQIDHVIVCLQFGAWVSEDSVVTLHSGSFDLGQDSLEDAVEWPAQPTFIDSKP
ncbi:MAG: hypothetical protein WCQ57_12165 [Verrucomicrobiota bacterium]